MVRKSFPAGDACSFARAVNTVKSQDEKNGTQQGEQHVRRKIGRIAESGEPHLTNSVLEDSWVGDPEWARREGMVAFAGFPLKVEEHVLGVVAAFARQPLTENALQAFAAVAGNIS